MQYHEDLIWSIIGENGFCCFKYNASNQNFCKNELNITGICSKQFCPLSKNVYATIIQKNGVIFLYVKNSLHNSYPNKTWKKILLSRNFIKAIQQIDFNLCFWPKIFLNKLKLRLTKLSQNLIRKKIRRMRIKGFIYSDSTYLKEEQSLRFYKKLEFEKIIEKELLNRLHMGVYGPNYNLKPICYLKKLKNIYTEKFNNKAYKMISN